MCADHRPPQSVCLGARPRTRASAGGDDHHVGLRWISTSEGGWVRTSSAVAEPPMTGRMQQREQAQGARGRLHNRPGYPINQDTCFLERTPSTLPHRGRASAAPLEGPMSIAAATTAPTSQVLSSAALLDHWQGHRRLTRRVIHALPEDQLLNFSPRRHASVRRDGDGAADGWRAHGARRRDHRVASSSASRAHVEEDVLRLWDEDTAALDQLFKENRPNVSRKP